MKKLISEQSQWGIVSKELDKENLKLMSYDKSLISLFENIKGKNILDYGCGPGVLALALVKLSACIKTFDISEEMRKTCSEKIGEKNVYNDVKKIPKNYFDIIICNLVLCINDENEVLNIVKNIKNLLNKNGRAFIGFCNPKIFNVPESRLDIREQTDYKYEENHSYKKTKKEGGYEIIENHRPIEWYESVYQKTGLS